MSIHHWFFCTGLALSGPAWAQTLPPPSTPPSTPTSTSPAAGPAKPADPTVRQVSPVAAAFVTLAQALQAARSHLEVSLAERNLAAARADILSADHAPAPVLTTKTAAIDLQNGVGPGNLWRDKRIDKSVGMDWTWERGNKRELRTRAAQRSAQAAQADLEEAVLQQQLLAASAYYELLAAQERTAQVQAIAQSASELARTAQRRLRAGDLSQQDTARSEIEAERAEADLMAAQAERARAELALAQATYLKGPLVAQAGWPAADTAPGLPESSAELRPDVRAAVQRAEAAQAALEGAQALRKNDLTLGTSLDHLPGTSTRLLELRLQMPLAGVLGNYGYQGELGRATAQLQQAEDQLEKTRRAAALDARRLQQDLLAASQRALRYQNAIVPRARQVASLAETAYGKGAMSLTELLDARRTLRASLLEDVAARADHARILALWQLRNPLPAQ
jgi:cobalt-zinc-cadmium efflux system outer membrane protein